MNKNILLTSDNIDSKKLVLANPNGIQGGSYMTKIKYNDDQSVFIQTPKLKTKQGIVSTDKRSYFDLLIESSNSELIEWIEQLEELFQEKIYEKRHSWFETSIDKEDIQNSMTPLLRPYKGGKFNLLRISIPTVKNLVGHNKCNIYDENENTLDMESINNECSIICILEIQGIKFSSKYFQIDIFARQIMVCKEREIFNSCMIIKNLENNVEKKKNQQEEEQKEETNVEEEIIEEPIINKDEIKEENILKPLEESVDENDNNENLTSLDEITENSKTSNDNTLEEIEIDINEMPEEIIQLKSKEFYYDIYRNALEKAKKAKQLALESFLEAKHIKDTYNLENLDDEIEDNLEENKKIFNELLS